MVSFLNNLIDKISGNASNSSASSGQASAQAIALPSDETAKPKATAEEQLRASVEKQITAMANLMGLNGIEKDNLVFSGGNAAMANGGVINQTSLASETSKVTGIDPKILALALNERNPNISGMMNVSQNSVQVGAGGGQQRGAGAAISA